MPEQTSSETPTVWVVYCPTHREYLQHVSIAGTTWTEDQAEAKRYDVKHQAVVAADRARWLDHDPVPWALATDTTAYVDRS